VSDVPGADDPAPMAKLLKFEQAENVFTHQSTQVACVE